MERCRQAELLLDDGIRLGSRPRIATAIHDVKWHSLEQRVLDVGKTRNSARADQTM
jgi:hypothetical protein